MGGISPPHSTYVSIPRSLSRSPLSRFKCSFPEPGISGLGVPEYYITNSAAVWDWEDRQVHRGGREALMPSETLAGRRCLHTCTHTKHMLPVVSSERLGKRVGVEAKETWREGLIRKPFKRKQPCQECFQITRLLFHVGRLLSFSPSGIFNSVASVCFSLAGSFVLRAT